MKHILIDADALIALIKDNDSNHKKALALAEKIAKDSVYITPFTVPETVTVISYKIGQKEARLFLKETRNNNFLEIPLTKELVEKTDELFLSQNRKDTSWIDCLNAVTVKTLRLDAIFSFDKFYQRIKIPVLA